MEIYQLRTFVAVARQGNLTQAAKRLHLSQPAVSGQIKALEEELGVALFTRTMTGVVLTKIGESLLPQAEQAIAIANSLLNQAKGMKGEVAGKVRVGTILDPDALQLGTFLAEMLRLHRQVDIEIDHAASEWVRQDVLSGRLDAGFFLGEIADPAIAAVKLREVTLLVAAPKAWEPRTAAAQWEEIAEMPWIWSSPQCAYARATSDMFRERGLQPPRKVIMTDHESVMKNLVMAGVGLALMREELAIAAAAAGELTVWAPARKRLPLSFIHLAARSRDPLMVAITDVMQEIWMSDHAMHPFGAASCLRCAIQSCSAA